MTKIAHGNIPTFKRAGNKAVKQFEQTMQDLGFSEVPSDEILKSILDQDRKKPKRATAENAIQRQFRYVSRNGYTVYIHTGMIGNKFSDRGSAWVMIVEQNKKRGKTTEKRIITREFYRNLSFSLLEKLSAYAQFFKNICDGRYRNKSGTFAHLVEDEIGWKTWESHKSSESKVFFLNHYFTNLSKEKRKIIKNKEISRLRYLKKTAGTVRREREFRSQWK